MFWNSSYSPPSCFSKLLLNILYFKGNLYWSNFRENKCIALLQTDFRKCYYCCCLENCLLLQGLLTNNNGRIIFFLQIEMAENLSKDFISAIAYFTGIILQQCCIPYPFSLVERFTKMEWQWVALTISNWSSMLKMPLRSSNHGNGMVASELYICSRGAHKFWQVLLKSLVFQL